MTVEHIKPSPEGVPGAVADLSVLRAEELTFPGSGGDAVNGYLVRPSEPGSYPGMIVIHEAMGLNEHIRGHAFFADYRPTYRPQAAAKLWQEIVPFLARHLAS